MSETKSLFGRAAKFVQDKAKEGKDAYDKRQLIQSLTELHGLRHHYENVLAEYDFHLLDREQLPNRRRWPTWMLKPCVQSGAGAFSKFSAWPVPRKRSSLK